MMCIFISIHVHVWAKAEGREHTTMDMLVKCGIDYAIYYIAITARLQVLEMKKVMFFRLELCYICL